MKLIYLLLILGLTFVLNTSCVSLTELVESTGLVNIEIVQGSINLENSENNSGVSVILNNENMDTTNNNGDFSFSIISFMRTLSSSATYSLTFSKDGFEETKIFIPTQHTDKIYTLEEITIEEEFTDDIVEENEEGSISGTINEETEKYYKEIIFTTDDPNDVVLVTKELPTQHQFGQMNNMKLQFYLEPIKANFEYQEIKKDTEYVFSFRILNKNNKTIFITLTYEDFEQKFQTIRLNDFY